MVERSGGGFGNGGKGNGGFNWNAMFNMSDISEKTRAHLTRVYATLFSSACSCVLGMWINSTFLMTGWLLTIAAIIGMVFFIY